MRKKCQAGWLAVGIAAVWMSGCQAWHPEAGLTLPSGFYLRHPAQYFPPSPPYPLQKELNSMEDAQRKLDEERPVGP